MACDTQPVKGQTLTERKAEVRDVIARLAADIVAGKVKPVVGPQGAIAFAGWTDRRQVSDGCAYRFLMSTGSAMAKAMIARAEILAGRPVDRKVVAAGVHSHNGGASWSHGHDH